MHPPCIQGEPDKDNAEDNRASPEPLAETLDQDGNGHSHRYGNPKIPTHGCQRRCSTSTTWLSVGATHWPSRCSCTLRFTNFSRETVLPVATSRLPMQAPA